jgi:hypothetical protein
MRPTFEELVQYREGEVTQARAAELERELAQSQELRAELERADALIAALGRPDAALEGVDLREGVSAQLSKPRPRLGAQRAFIGAALALAAGLAVLVFIPRDDVRAKGAPLHPCGLDVFVREGGVAHHAGGDIAADAALGFAYKNLDPSPYRYLMIYAVDARGGVEWYYPAWTDSEANPASVPVAAGAQAVELPEAVQHALPKGPLRVHALFTTQPKTVREVEAQLSQGGRFDGAEDVEQGLNVR